MNMLRCKIPNCLVFGSILLAAVTLHGQEFQQTSHTYGGQQIFKSTSTKPNVRKCTLSLPDGSKCTYEPGQTTPPPSRTCNFPDLAILTYCSFQVEILSTQLSGIYTLTAQHTNGSLTEDIYTIFLYAGGFPDKVTVIEGENLYLRMAGSFDDTMLCTVTYPNGTSEILSGGPGASSQNHWGRKDECGVVVDGVADYHAGNWRLEVNSSTAFVYTLIQVQVILLKDIDTRPPPPIEWIYGQAGTVSMSQSHSKYCEIWNPNNELVQRRMYTSCSYTRSFVTGADNGNWTIVFGMDGKLTEDKFIQKIEVIKGELVVNVSASERFQHGLDLLCTVSPGPVAGCNFTRPDGEVLIPAEGIGNANYSYFGEGFMNGDCGLTIHTPQAVDNGWWECSVTAGGTKRSGFLNVSATEDTDVGTHEAVTVVRNGSTFYLSYKAHQALEYCWFRHPTGLHIRFSTQVVPLDGLPDSPRYYMYDDTLQSGICRLGVQEAKSTVDRGQWTGHLGIRGSPEEDHAIPFTVEVSDSDVISFDKELDLSDGTTVLKCYSVPLGRPLEYCRFLRPDGIGFNVVPGSSTAVLGHYEYEAEGLEKGVCGLRIMSGTEEDEGEWTCVARLQGQKQEGQDFITLKRSGRTEDGRLSVGSIIGIVVGAAVILLAIVGLTFFVIRCKTQE